MGVLGRVERFLKHGLVPGCCLESGYRTRLSGQGAREYTVREEDRPIMLSQAPAVP